MCALQVLLFPCWDLEEESNPSQQEEYDAWKEMRSPRCAGAPGVRVMCRRKTEGYADVQYPCLLRGPQRGGALSSAAYRRVVSHNPLKLQNVTTPTLDR